MCGSQKGEWTVRSGSVVLGCPHNATISLGFHVLPLTVLLYLVLIFFTFFLAVELLSWTEITLWILIINYFMTIMLQIKLLEKIIQKETKSQANGLIQKVSILFSLITHEYPQNLIRHYSDEGLNSYWWPIYINNLVDWTESSDLK